MIDLSKSKTLSDSVIVSGKVYCIHTDFQFFITFQRMCNEKHALSDFDFMFVEVPKDEHKAEALKALISFAYPKKELPREIESVNDEILIDYELDSDLIYSAFYEQYKIDLKADNLHLHWYKFRALLDGLQNTKLNKVIEYRSYIPSQSDGKEYKKFMLKMKDAWRIERKLTDSEQKAIEKFDALLGNK